LSEAIINFSTDFNSLKNVYTIENLAKDEADTLMLKYSE